MRIVFMGTAEFGLPSLNILLQNRYPVVGVVTNPDKPSGRGQKVVQSPIKQEGLKHQLPILQPESLGDPEFIAQLHALKPDLFVVVAFRILPPEVFTIPKHGAFNLHASLLPKYRGAAPIQWAIMKGESETGVTTFFLDKSVDTGNIILQARIPIGVEDTAGDIYPKLAEVGAEIVLHTVRLIQLGNAVPKPQDNTLASPAPKIFKEDCAIDWNRQAIVVHNFVRGLSPIPCAYTFHQSTQLKIYRTRVVQQLKQVSAGEIVQADTRLVVGAASDAIEILQIQQEGRKMLAAEEFLRGYRLKPGDKLLS